MNVAYPAIYEDQHGQEKTVIHNDGKTLRMIVRGVELVGDEFDDFSPVEGAPTNDLLTFDCNMLCNCAITYEMPMPMVANGEPDEAHLHIRLVLGSLVPNGGLDKETVHITLTYKGIAYAGSGTSGWFEDELLEIQASLPEGVFMKACINCAFSDYSPYGHGIFGCMLCFRDNKANYLAVRSKSDFFKIMGSSTEDVQETYLCPEFQRRKPGTGYRG